MYEEQAISQKRISFAKILLFSFFNALLTFISYPGFPSMAEVNLWSATLFSGLLAFWTCALTAGKKRRFLPRQRIPCRKCTWSPQGKELFFILCILWWTWPHVETVLKKCGLLISSGKGFRRRCKTYRVGNSGFTVVRTRMSLSLCYYLLLHHIFSRWIIVNLLLSTPVYASSSWDWKRGSQENLGRDLPTNTLQGLGN